MVPITDISHAQGNVDFHRMAANGVVGCIIRLGNGDVLDDRGAKYTADAVAAGLKIGFYWFCNPKKDATGDVQMRRFSRRAAELGGADIPLMMDVEDFSNEGGHLPALSGDPWLRWLMAGKDQIADDTGDVPIVYTNGSYWDREVRAIGTMGECPLMCARYPFYSVLACAANRPPTDAAQWETWIMGRTTKRPTIPKGWAGWAGWQFSAGYNRMGAVYGASSADLDLNLVRDDVWAKWTVHDAPAPIEQQPVAPVIPSSPHPLSIEEDDMKFIMRRKSDGASWLVWLQGGRWQASGLGGTGAFEPEDAADAMQGPVAPVWNTTDARTKFWLDKVTADANAGS